MKYPPVHIKDIPISKMEEKNGWNISEFRLPITGESGSSTTVFHSIFKPGSTHSKHLHSMPRNSDVSQRAWGCGTRQ